jgi:hypothetical protein
MSANGRRLFLGGVTVVLVVVIVWLAAATVASNRSTTNLGDDRFEDVRAERVISDVEVGGPVFYPDLTDGRRDIWITHLGEDPLAGFLVLSARAPSECLVQWDRDAGDFYDICDETARFPADGGDLARYPVEISDGKLIIDLNFATRSEP